METRIRMAIYIRYVLMLGLILSSFSGSGQVNDVHFGKNRVQYSDDFDSRWIYDTEHFTLYWYGKARIPAIKTIGFAEMDFERTQQILEYKISRPIEILVFANLEDLKQSNLGLEDVFTLTDQVTKVYGNKVLLFYDGDTRNLRKQIREGIAQVMLKSMLYGDFLKEVFQKTYLKRMPKWFEMGLASYCGESWNPTIEARMHKLYKDGFLEEDFQRWAARYPVLGGHAFWHFIAEKYGENSISDFLYLIRINKEIYQSAFFAFGEEWEHLTADITKYYKDRYGKIDPLFEDVSDKNHTPFLSIKHDPSITGIRKGPKAHQWTLALNNMGKRRVYLIDSTSKGMHRKTIFRDGSYNILQPPDLEYPKISVAPDSTFIAVLYNRRGALYLKRYTPEGELLDFQALRPEIRRVFDMDITLGGDLLLSADISGSADVLLYDISTRNIHTLLQDFWDDPDLCYFIHKNEEGAIIASNRDSDLSLLRKVRMDTSLPDKKMDLYLLTWTKDKTPKKLVRLTNTPQANERHPLQIGPNRLSYISDYLGRDNLHWLSMEHIPVTDYGHVSTLLIEPIGNYWWNASSEIIAELSVGEKQHQIFSLKPIDNTTAPSSLLTLKKSKHNKSKERDTTITNATSYDPLHFFQSKYPLPPSFVGLPQPNALTTEHLLSMLNGNAPSKGGKPAKYNSAQAYAYQKQFRIYNIGTTLDNSPLFDGLIAYENINGSKLTDGPLRPPSGLLLKLHLKELFEDYELILGNRVTSGLESWEQYIQWVNKKHLLDKTWTFYRHSRKHSRTTPTLELIYSKDIDLVAQYQIKYPLDVYRSLRASATFRQEQSFDLITDKKTLQLPTLDRQRVGVKLAYVMDNTTLLDLNLLRGTRYTISIEWLKRFTIDLSPWEFSLRDPWMFVTKWDARHYIPILKHSVFAMRWAGALSMGPERILYLLGGTSDEINYSVNPGYPVSPDVSFGYKTVAPPLRGFSYNARNGSAYTIGNAELRIPIMKYLSRQPSKWSFIRHLQLVGFADAGLGWYGWNPFDPKSNHNIQSFENPAVNLKVRFYTDPVLLGYGIGFRTSLLGYFLRADYAWGISNSTPQSPKLHLSLGLDF